MTRPTARTAAEGREAPGSLRDFYENPAVPVASGDDRSRRQARMLAAALGPVRDGEPPAVIADVGCGDGSAAAVAAAVLDELRPGGQRIVAVDWSQDALRRAAARARGAAPGTPVSVVRGALPDGAGPSPAGPQAQADAGPAGQAGGLPLRTGGADAVVFSEVVEHLVDPDAALDELRRVLRPGGHLLLSTPNLAAWYNRVLLLAGVQPVFSEVSLRGIHGRPGSQVVGHLRLYTARALRGFLEAAGFTVVRVAGAPYHDVPRPLRPVDRVACRTPSLASILLVHARRE